MRTCTGGCGDGDCLACGEAMRAFGCAPLNSDDDLRAPRVWRYPDCPDERYRPLWNVLMRAWDQAVNGKGADRHGTPEPYEQQPTAFLARQFGTGGPAFQSGKKLVEAHRMESRGEKQAANRERLGAIVYAAFAVIESERTP